MRAYRKRTRHPVCLYLTLEEARMAIAELEDATSEDWATDPETLRRILERLRGVSGGEPQ